MGDSIQMTLDEKLKQFKDMGNPAIDFLLAALRRCREQRDDYLRRCYHEGATVQRMCDCDAELLALLQGLGK